MHLNDLQLDMFTASHRCKKWGESCIFGK